MAPLPEEVAWFMTAVSCSSLAVPPLTKTPPSNMKLIPGVTASASPPKNVNPVANCKAQAAAAHVSPVLAKGTDSDEQQFEMDI